MANTNQERPDYSDDEGVIHSDTEERQDGVDQDGEIHSDDGEAGPGIAAEIYSDIEGDEDDVAMDGEQREVTQEEDGEGEQAEVEGERQGKDIDQASLNSDVHHLCTSGTPLFLYGRRQLIEKRCTQVNHDGAKPIGITRRLN